MIKMQPNLMNFWKRRHKVNKELEMNKQSKLDSVLIRTYQSIVIYKNMKIQIKYLHCYYKYKTTLIKQNSTISRQAMQQSQHPQETQQQQNRQKTHPMLKLLKQYHLKLTQHQSNHNHHFQLLKQAITSHFQSQLKQHLTQFQAQFLKQKQIFSTQIKTVEYYLQHFLSRHSLNPKQNNLYPLFNQIDHKISLNQHYLKNKFVFQFHYPQTKVHLNHKVDAIKYQLIEQQLKQTRNFILRNQNFSKHCPKDLNQFKLIQQQYQTLLQQAQIQLYCRQINFTGNFQQSLILLKNSNKIQKLYLAIRSQTGKLSLEQYQQLFTHLEKSANLLTHFTLKFMDMEFEQRKCNEVKSLVKRLKCIKNIKIQNYFRQNKLGLFEDFNWLPLKKQTHIIGKVW